MDILINVAISLAGVILGFVLHEVYFRFSENNSKFHSQNIIEDARREAEKIIEKAEKKIQEEFDYKKNLYEKEITIIKEELEEVEKNIRQKKENLTSKLQSLNLQEERIKQEEKNILNKKEYLAKEINKVEKLINEEKKALENIANVSSSEAETILLKKLEQQLEKEISEKITKLDNTYKKEWEKKAQRITLLAIQRCAVEYTAENVVSVINLPNEEMKGRIIGREGRNIRTFEKITGIDVVVDDTPGVIVLSGFNPLRREIAKIAMEKLVLDGRIHPSRIEEIVMQTQKELNNIVIEEGKQVCYETNVANLHSSLIELIGRMKFHLFMGITLLQHTLEIVDITSYIAGELKLDVQLAKRCALLHDIGRVVEDNLEGHHSVIGADIARQYMEPDIVVNAILCHYEGTPNSLYGVVLQVAHNIVFSRPSGRKESLEKHLKRLKNLEELVSSFEEVEQVYAIDSGKEVRCIVKSNNVSEYRAPILAREIALKINKEFLYSGEIKVSLTRECKIVEYSA